MISIVVIDDHGAEAVRLAKELRPDVVLMDLLMPSMTSITAIKMLREQTPDYVVLHAFRKYASASRLHNEQEVLAIAKDGTVSYSYTFSDYLRVNGGIIPEPPAPRQHVLIQ